MKLRCAVLAALLPATGIYAQEHVGQSSPADVERGAGLYSANCSFCHGASGDSIAGVDLRSGKFRHAVSDEDLGRVILAGIPGTAMPPHKFDAMEINGVIAYIRSMRDFNTAPVATGDPIRGRDLYEGKGACNGCHRIGSAGSRMAPDLTAIGTIRAAAVLEQKLLDPNSTMLPINRSVRAITKTGKVISGRRLNEDTFSVQILDSHENLVSLMKSDLTEYTVLPITPMPSYKDKLTGQEISDVVAYLLTLKGIN
jgi:putative heme-binding domain-containing protein